MPTPLFLEPLEDRLVPAPILLSIQRTEVGVFRNGTWILDNTNSHQILSTDITFVYGLPTDTPITGDWNAGPVTEVGVFRALPNGDGEFILDVQNHHHFDSTSAVFIFGLATDTPISGDWSGTGNDKVGVYRNVNGAGLFVLDTDGHQQFDVTSTVFFFDGGAGKPVVGDWNGNGLDKVGVFRPALNGFPGQFVLDYNGSHLLTNSLTFIYGISTDTPVIGNWSGSTFPAVGVVRNTGNGGLVWSLDFNNNQVFDVPPDQVFVFGQNGDRPVVGVW
jgi:hypothetical protein